MQRFSIVPITSGLLFGVYTFIRYWGDNLLTIVPISFLAGIIFGATIGFIFFHAGKGLSISCINFIGLTLLMCLTGLVMGNVLIFPIAQLPHGYWTPLEDAPEKPIRFLTNSAFSFWGGSIYIETEKGNIWSHTCDSENPCGWKKENSPPLPPEENFWSCDGRATGGSFAPPLFDKVRDSYEVNICGADYTQQLKFILSDNGQISVWSNFQSALETMGILMVSSVVSPAISFISLLAALAQKKRIIKGIGNSRPTRHAGDALRETNHGA